MTDSIADTVSGLFTGSADALLIEAVEFGTALDPGAVTRLTLGAVDHRCGPVPQSVKDAVAAAADRLCDRIASGVDPGGVLVEEAAALRAAVARADTASAWAAAWAAAAPATVPTDPATVDTAALAWAGRIAAATDAAAAGVPAERRAAARRSLEHFAVLAATLALGTARGSEDPDATLNKEVAQMVPALAARAESVLISLVEMTDDEEDELQVIAAGEAATPLGSRIAERFAGAGLTEGITELRSEAQALPAGAADRAGAQRVLRDMGDLR